MRRNIKERIIEFILMLAALSAVATTLSIVAILLYESLSFFKTVSLVDFFTDTQWTPLFEDAHYGILPLVSGTLTTSAVALAVAIPVGTIGAIYLSEFASHKTREIVKPIIRTVGGRTYHCVWLLCIVIFNTLYCKKYSLSCPALIC